MPADDATIRTTIERYTATFSKGDREGWLALWADDATMEDPVGTPVKHGKDEIAAFFDQSTSTADEIELRLVDITIPVAGQAAFAFEVRPTIGGQVMILPAIDVMTFDDAGRITSQRAFVDFNQIRPAESVRD